MQFFPPISSHLGKFINIKDSSTNENIKIQTPKLKVYKITDKVIIVETDESIRKWLTDFENISTYHFKQYLPRNKQVSSFEGMNSYFTIKIKDDTDIFYKTDNLENDIFIHSLSKINIGDNIILLIETPGIWVNRSFYGITWTAKQILAII